MHFRSCFRRDLSQAPRRPVLATTALVVWSGRRHATSRVTLETARSDHDPHLGHYPDRSLHPVRGRAGNPRRVSCHGRNHHLGHHHHHHRLACRHEPRKRSRRSMRGRPMNPAGPKLRTRSPRRKSRRRSVPEQQHAPQSAKRSPVRGSNGIPATNTPRLHATKHKYSWIYHPPTTTTRWSRGIRNWSARCRGERVHVVLGAHRSIRSSVLRTTCNCCRGSNGISDVSVRTWRKASDFGGCLGGRPGVEGYSFATSISVVPAAFCRAWFSSIACRMCGGTTTSFANSLRAARRSNHVDTAGCSRAIG